MGSPVTSPLSPAWTLRVVERTMGTVWTAWHRPARCCDVLRPVVGAHEGDQGDLVLPGQVAQHVVGAHLGAGVERVGEDLGEEEDVEHRERVIG